MIKAVLSVKENLEINKFTRVISFLKRQEINTFLVNADDAKYLLIKVSLKSYFSF